MIKPIPVKPLHGGATYIVHHEAFAIGKIEPPTLIVYRHDMLTTSVASYMQTFTRMSELNEKCCFSNRMVPVGTVLNSIYICDSMERDGFEPSEK